MSDIAWFVSAAAMLPAFGLAVWLRFVYDPLEADMCAVVLSQSIDFSMRAGWRHGVPASTLFPLYPHSRLTK